MTQKRIGWIDAAKFFAVIAVAVDHCNGFLYTNQLIAYASYYSVSLFVLLAGISIWIAYNRGKEISFVGQLKKVRSIFCAYALATLIVLCIAQHRFDLKTYLEHLVSFNIQGPYYYIVFFVQLLMIAPILVRWCRFANSKKHKWIVHIGSLCALGWFAYISINYTYILPVHGGGQFLWGGTYVILYYLGMLLASNSVFERRITRHALRAGICLAISIIWVWLMAEGRLPFDKWLSPYWGGGFNPPGIHFMVYSLLVLFICNGGWALLHEVRCRPVQKVVSGICFLGRNTLYIWLYHMVVHSFFVAHFPDLLSRNIWIRLFVFLAIVTVPVIIKQMIHVLCSFCCEKISQAEKELP